MKTLLLSLLVLAALAGLAMADTNVTGNWSGSFNITNPNGESKDATAFLMLKQNGADITGTVGPNEDEQFPIQKGKIEGDKITLVAEHDGHTIQLNLVMAADRITGEADMSGDEGKMTAKLDLKRVAK